MSHVLTEEELQKRRLAAIGDTLAILHDRAYDEVVDSGPVDPKDLAAIIHDLIAALRTFFPAPPESEWPGPRP